MEEEGRIAHHTNYPLWEGEECCLANLGIGQAWIPVRLKGEDPPQTFCVRVTVGSFELVRADFIPPA